MNRLRQADHRVLAWWRDQPLRRRLAAAAAAAVVLTLSAVIGVAYAAVRHELVGQLDTELRHVQVHLTEGVDPSTGLPQLGFGGPRFGEEGSYQQLVSASGAVEPMPGQGVVLPLSGDDRAIAAGRHPAAFRDARVNGARVRMLTEPVAPGVAVQVAVSAAGVVAELHRIGWAFSALAVAGLLVAVGLVSLVARTALAPVRRLTETAEQVALTGDLSYRIADSRRDELGRLAASFNRMLDALQRSVSAQRQLVADASHELRTPLASVRTNAEVLRRVDELTPEQREQVIAGLVGQVEELTGLVSDVVELARGDEPTTVAHDVAFDALVRSSVERAQRLWPDTRFSLDTEPVAVRGDADRLQRAVGNLLDNAAKFSGVGGQVRVRLAADGRLTVHDTGPGVPEDALPYVFDRFYRAAEARALPGSGLGLAIVRQAVERHGGTVALRNDPTGGTVAELTLPVLREAVSPPPQGSQDTLPLRSV